MNNTSEKISIIMGIYNCEKTLPEAIESILAQTYTNWELIMCDDCSTDNTYSIAKKYQEKYTDKIILVRNNENCRLAYSLNHCLKYASGKYIARMDGDDISLPHRFERQIEFLEKNPNAKIWMATTKAKHVHSDVEFGPDDYIMFGKESAGIPEELLMKDKERCIRIPMLEQIRSLNLSNSVAIAVYEALRQKSFEGLS